MAKVRHYIKITCELWKNILHFTFSIPCVMITVGLHCNKSLNIAEIYWTRFLLESMTNWKTEKSKQ
jgi:hypothetical protein